MSAVSRAGREHLLRVFGWRCAYCDKPLTRHTATGDHYMPLALGGSDAFENLRLACGPCNNLKADMHPDDWERVRPRPVRKPDAKRELLERCAARPESMWRLRDKGLA